MTLALGSGLTAGVAAKYFYSYKTTAVWVRLYPSSGGTSQRVWTYQ